MRGYPKEKSDILLLLSSFFFLLANDLGTLHVITPQTSNETSDLTNHMIFYRNDLELAPVCFELTVRRLWIQVCVSLGTEKDWCSLSLALTLFSSPLSFGRDTWWWATMLYHHISRWSRKPRAFRSAAKCWPWTSRRSRPTQTGMRSKHQSIFPSLLSDLISFCLEPCSLHTQMIYPEECRAAISPELSLHGVNQ